MNGRVGAAVTFLLSLTVIVMVFLLPPGWLALPLFGMAVGLFLARKSSAWSDLFAPVLMAALALFVFVADSRRAAMGYPVVINLGLLAYFWGSLRGGQTAIERLARLEQPELPPEGVRYTRTLTKVWCGFFVVNGALAALTAWHGDARLWAAYNGCVAYVLIGVLLLGERLLRPYLTRRLQTVVAASVAERLMGAGRSADDIVCVVGEMPVTLRRFREEVVARARSVAARPAADWVIDAPDGFRFAVDLMAVCLSGRHAIVPQNHQPATLAALRLRHPDAAFCGDTVPSSPGSEAWRPAEGGRISFYTSGSTGEPKCVTRSFAALVGEADGLERLFGDRLGLAQVIGTVPHHFIYGTIFRIVWPLWAGRVFRPESLGDGYAILACLKAGGDFVLVSSPSLLERMPAEDLKGVERLRGVFSSGSLLRADVARRWSSPVEIFGSTETGGVAYRRQFVGDEAWQVLPDVSVSAASDGRLCVRSPFVAPGCESTSDAVRLLGEGRFELLGRIDRIAKVEGRRVSLAEIEAVIEAHPAVRRCVVFQPEGHARLAAAVVPRVELPEIDHLALCAQLREILAERHDPVVVPRRWKFVPRLPADSRGKTTPAVLRSVFDPPAEGFPPEACWPQVLGHRWQGDEVRVLLKVPAELPLFAGHFPDLPILPGVALMGWASLFASAYLGVGAEFTIVDNLKFTAAVYPGESLELTLIRLPDGVRFRYDCAGAPKASGALLRPPARHA